MNAAAVARMLTFVCIKAVLLKVGWVRVGGGENKKKEEKRRKAKKSEAHLRGLVPEIISIAARTGFLVTLVCKHGDIPDR